MIDKRRIKQLNQKETTEGPVVYWMNRDCRADDNWALLYAQEQALERKEPLVVVYNLEYGFLGGSKHQHIFKVQGLQEVEKDLKEKHIPFVVLADVDSEKRLIGYLQKIKVGHVVTDFSPLRIQREWMDKVAKEIDVRCDVVDTHNIVPVWTTSDKKEYAARTIRPKLHKLLPEFVTDIPSLKKHPHAFSTKTPAPDWQEIKNSNHVHDRGTRVDFVGGASEAKKQLKHFIENTYPEYADKRNDPNEDGQSDLSPYLHYGHISAQRVALEILEYAHRKIDTVLDAERNGAGTSENAAAFLEELIIRKELSDNFCWYEPNYDSSKCFPDWAQKTLQEHKNDKREYTYSYTEFENGDTHEPLWNACQRQMTKGGKMHGYMRMYWAKKILEWTKDPDEAMEVAIKLNDTYEIDGRDPNGYAGIAWSMGGVHDRAWFEREVFGKIRYMNRGGCEKKFDVDAYIKKWL